MIAVQRWTDTGSLSRGIEKTANNSPETKKEVASEVLTIRPGVSAIAVASGGCDQLRQRLRRKSCTTCTNVALNAPNPVGFGQKTESALAGLSIGDFDKNIHFAKATSSTLVFADLA